MRISELIAALQKLQAEHGDIPVKCWPYDGQDEAALSDPVPRVEEFPGLEKFAEFRGD